ncbi:DNA mismatch repair protein MSH3 [Termitomyces sp. T112]|nr:DNA mismatch repair protein MSH3 [Termitomyces sp. T112]
MPLKKTPERSQPTISSFFQPSQRSSSGKRASSPIQLDLTSDTDEEPPAKRLKKSGASDRSGEPTTPLRASVASQWRFTSVSPDKLASAAPTQSTEAEAVAAEERRKAFRKKLLLENNPFIRKPSQFDLSRAASSIEAEEAESAGEESDHAFKELNALFSNKNKGKGKAARSTASKSKKHVAIGPSGEPYTPLEQQVLQFKEENPGTILFFEVGYKYRFFGDDAKVAAKELGMVAFEHRNFLVASIPTHRLHVHLKKLLSRGYRVGIVGQIETAALKKAGDNRNAPFKRELLHLYTAATYVDDLDSVDDLERYNPPPFMCIVEQAKKSITGDVSFGMITISPSTGDVVWDDFEDTLMRIELETRLVHTRPAELLLPEIELSGPTTKMLQHFTRNSSVGDGTRTEYFKEIMSYTDAFDLVSEFYTNKTHSAVASDNFKSGHLMAEVADFPKRVVIALAHAIKYLSAFSIADAFLETKFFTKFTTKTHMLLAANTLTNLEIYRNETDGTVIGSLLWLLDKTKTKFGARLLRSWIGRPLVDKRMLNERAEAVEEILESPSEQLVTLRQILRKLPDLAKGLCRIQYGQCTPQELAVLLPAFNKIGQAFDNFESPSDVGFRSSLLNEIVFLLPKLKGPMKELMSAIRLDQAAEGRKDIMWTDPERYPEINDADVAIQIVNVELDDQLKAIRKLLRMPSLQWTTHLKDEFLVEHKNSDKRPIPDHWILHSKTRVVSRHQPPTVREKMEERLRYQETLQAAANKAFSSFLEEIALNYYNILRNAINKLATADCLLSLAQVALQENYVRPTFTDNDALEIIDGRHPMVEALRPDPFVPNTVVMGGGKPRSKIITGPNMGGKSSCVRMVALIAIMAQIGSYVPATSVKMGLVDTVLTRMGASDDLARGRSTFMVEMSETSEILSSATKHSLVILDELGRGTSTFDGMAIADAVLQQLVENTKSKTLFITHYPLVASNLESQYPLDAENLHMGFEEETRVNGVREITFLYRLTPGMASGSFGIECGRLAGLPESLLSVATESAAKLQRHIKDRTRRNRILKSTKLLADYINGGMVETFKIEELRVMAKSIFDSSAL